MCIPNFADDSFVVVAARVVGLGDWTTNSVPVFTACGRGMQYEFVNPSQTSVVSVGYMPDE